MVNHAVIPLRSELYGIMPSVFKVKHDLLAVVLYQPFPVLNYIAIFAYITRIVLTVAVDFVITKGKARPGDIVSALHLGRLTLASTGIAPAHVTVSNIQAENIIKLFLESGTRFLLSHE